MNKSITFSIPVLNDIKKFQVDYGKSLIFIGANSSGKTRLACQIEDQLGQIAHRVSAHRSLKLNAKLAKTNEEVARNILRTGNSYGGIRDRNGHRHSNDQFVAQLTDFDPLLQTLEAQHISISLQVRERLIEIRNSNVGEGDNLQNSSLQTPETLLEKTIGIWNSYITHRKMVYEKSELKIKDNESQNTYSAEQASDGERSLFYMIGQVLCLESASLIIIDEPELYMHPSLTNKLWMKLTIVRRDCVFLFITHDLAFASSMVGQKFAINNCIYKPEGPRWDLIDITNQNGFKEEILVRILGSRRDVLFVEGELKSLDFMIYNLVYSNHTVIPCGSNEKVKEVVKAFKQMEKLTRLSCKGIIDGDNLPEKVVSKLKSIDIHVLKVAQLENLFLYKPIAVLLLNFNQEEMNVHNLEKFYVMVYEHVTLKENIKKACLRDFQRFYDRRMKDIFGQKCSTAEELIDLIEENHDINEFKILVANFKIELMKAAENKDIAKIALIFNHKSLKQLIYTKLAGTKNFDEFQKILLGRLTSQNSTLLKVIKEHLPDL